MWVPSPFLPTPCSSWGLHWDSHEWDCKSSKWIYGFGYLIRIRWQFCFLWSHLVLTSDSSAHTYQFPKECTVEPSLRGGEGKHLTNLNQQSQKATLDKGREGELSSREDRTGLWCVVVHNTPEQGMWARSLRVPGKLFFFFFLQNWTPQKLLGSTTPQIYSRLEQDLL